MRVLLLFLLVSCASSMTQTYIQEGEFELRAGQSADKNWDSSIMLNHVSWFTELTLIFDVYYINANKVADFKSWFSKFETETVNSCKTAYVSLVYDLIDKRYTKKAFYQMLREQGFEVLEVPNFTDHFMLHPDYEELSFNLYELKLLCHKEADKKIAGVTIPSFPTVNFKL